MFKRKNIKRIFTDTCSLCKQRKTLIGEKTNLPGYFHRKRNNIAYPSV